MSTVYMCVHACGEHPRMSYCIRYDRHRDSVAGYWLPSRDVACVLHHTLSCWCCVGSGASHTVAYVTLVLVLVM